MKRKIDLIITTCYKPEQTARLLQSIIANTNLDNDDIKIVLVDDSGSSEYSKFLENFLEELKLKQFTEVINHSECKGFIESSYSGLTFRDSEYKVFIHNDTVVTEGWLEKMLETADKDPSIAMVNPVSNYSPILSVGMPDGWTLANMHKFISNFEVKDSDYLDIVTATDFCVLIKYEYIKKYGFYDRAYTDGYGAIADLHFRYLTQGLRMVVSPNAFVYHQGTGVEDNPNDQFEKNRKMLFDRYKDVHNSTIKTFQEKSVLNRIRKKLKETNPKLEALFVMPSNNPAGGGVKIVHNICNALNEKGISATIACTWNDKLDYRIDRLYSPIFYEHLFEKELKPKVIAFSLDHQAYEVVKLAEYIYQKYGYIPKIVQIAQDVEAWFEYHDMESFITYANFADEILSVSPFVENVIKQNLPNKKITVIKNSISSNFIANNLKIKDRLKKDDDNELTFIAMMREDQKRGAKVIENALYEVDKKIDEKIKFIGFGSDFKFKKKLKNINTELYKRINEEKVSELMARSDVIIEASYYQGFGLVAIEGLFANCFVISSSNEGAAGVLPKSERITFFEVGNYQNLANKILNYVKDPQKYSTPDYSTIFEYTNRRIFDKYYNFFKPIINKKLSKSYEEFAQSSVKVLLEYYKFIEQHYLYDKPLKTRHKLVDAIVEPILKNNTIKNISSKTIMTIKKLREV